MSHPQKNPIRLIALDMDGTVLKDNKTISPRVADALRKAVAQGVIVVPATGRTGNGVPQALMELTHSPYVITANGARVVELATGECLMEELMPLDLALTAFDALQKYDCVLDLFHAGNGYSTPENLILNERLLPENIKEYVRTTRVIVPDLRAFTETQIDGVEKWTMFFGDETERQTAWAEMQALGFEVVSSLPRNMELNAKGVNKGKGLRALAAHLGIPMEQTMACGDGGNDIAMVQCAGIGVAMANGMDEVKAVADFVTETNEKDGVALAIERFVLE